MEQTAAAAAGDRPRVMVTNDDGIDAPGLRALVAALVAADRFDVLVCAPDSEKSAVSHSITWRHPISAKHTDIPGTMAFAVSGHSVYSGTVGGAREAFFNGVPALSLSYDWVRGTSRVDDYTLAAEACLPIINGILAEIKNKTYPQKCFLNVDFPTDVANHKGYKLTKQGKSIFRMGWKQVTSNKQGGKMLSTMTMETNPASSTQIDGSTMPPDSLIFTRGVIGEQIEEEDDTTDHRSVKEGYISITPLGALSNADMDCHEYFRGWLPGCLH